MRGGERVGHVCDVAEVAAREEVRVADCENCAGGRAVAVCGGGGQAVADCVERRCDVEVRVAMEDK